MRFLVMLLSVTILGRAQVAKEGTPGDALKTVTIRKILVEGTRLPSLSVIRLAQIQAGDQVDFLKLHTAMQKVTKTGLIKNIDFEYESLPDQETDVLLHLKCTDTSPLAQASIQIKNVDENDVWKWLAGVDPLFTREMPPTEEAIRFYSPWITKYLEGHGNPEFSEKFAVVAETTSSNGAAVPDHVIFKTAKLHGLR